MRKYKYIKKLIEEPLALEGFQYEGHNPCGIWIFSRTKGEVKQYIDVRIERFYPDSMLLYVNTNAYGRTEKMIGSGLFKDEIEFENLMKNFCEIIFQKSFDELEKMSKPTTEIRSTVEMEQYLYDNHECLNEAYSKILNVDNNLSPDVVFSAIYQFMDEHRADDFQKIKKDLIGIAAVYGHLVERIFQNTWMMNEYPLCEVSGKSTFVPLGSIILDWRVPSAFNTKINFYYSLNYYGMADTILNPK